MSHVNLIPLHTAIFQNDTQQAVNARELHEFLEVGRDFATWIKQRLDKYGFVENEDFVIAPQTGERKNQ